MDESKKRKQIRAYFFPYDRPEKPESSSTGTTLIIIGIAMALSSWVLLSQDAVDAFRAGIAFLAGVGLFVWGTQRNATEKSDKAKYEKSLEKYNDRLSEWGLKESDLKESPSGQQIDAWLQEDLQNITEDALTHKLGLVRDQLKRDPLVIYGPLLWTTYGIPDEDLVYAREKPSNTLRFSCYRIVVVFLTDARVATYSCNFNFLRNARVGEKTVEYLYQDIVSVSTEEVSTNYSLPDGKTLQRAKVFRLAVASGDRIEVVVNSPQLKDMLDGTLNLEDQDQNVRIIREMLRTKKG